MGGAVQMSHHKGRLWPTRDLFPAGGLPGFRRPPGSITAVGTGCGMVTTPIGMLNFQASGTSDVARRCSSR
jgi:hypothetical protein